MNTKNQIAKNDDENPFKDMGFIKFWIVSTVFWFSFPVSLVLCCLALGSVKTKQLVKALVHDFLQTLFMILVVVCVIVYDSLSLYFWTVLKRFELLKYIFWIEMSVSEQLQYILMSRYEGCFWNRHYHLKEPCDYFVS